MSVNHLQQTGATQGYNIIGGGNKQELDAVMDNTPTEDSNNPVTSGGIYSALEDVYTEIDTKEDKLTFDTSPTSGSDNPVTSDGIFDALEAVAGSRLIKAVLTIPQSDVSTIPGLTPTIYGVLVSDINSNLRNAHANIDTSKPIYIFEEALNAPDFITSIILDFNSVDSLKPYSEAFEITSRVTAYRLLYYTGIENSIYFRCIGANSNGSTKITVWGYPLN